jgi:hypothetical protein
MVLKRERVLGPARKNAPYLSFLAQRSRKLIFPRHLHLKIGMMKRSISCKFKGC